MKRALLWVGIFLAGSQLLTSCHPAKQKLCSDMKVVMFVGGKPGAAFSETIKKGAEDAADALGCTVEYVWSNWDSGQMLQQFKEAIHEAPDAICIMGHPGEDDMLPLIEEANRKGILVTLLNADLPGIRSDYVSKGFGYAGQDTYQSGFQLGQALAQKCTEQLPLNALVYTWDYSPDRPLSHRAKRSQGIIDGLKQNSISVNYEDMPASIKANCSTEELAKYLRMTLEKHPNTSLIVADSGHITAMLSSALQICEFKPGEIIAAGFDLSATTIKGIQDEYLTIVHDQQPYLQGFLPIIQACLSYKYGFAGLNINTGSGLIDKANLDLVVLSEWVQQNIR